MILRNLGFTTELENHRKEFNLKAFEVGRVIAHHKDRYTVKTESTEFDAELIGNLRFTASSNQDLPWVGDWVAISAYDENKALIHAVYPRNSLVERKAIGKLGDTQIIATNIDFGLIVQSVNRDFNINRIERYLTICHASKITPIVILSKIDLIDKNDVASIVDAIENRNKNISVIALSNETDTGLDAIKRLLQKGKTYCLLGSSGVGKSTLINKLLGENKMVTGAISEGIDRGKHVTTHRELIVTEYGILIDNPGMREVGITASSTGLDKTFDEIVALAQGCKFKDCTHTNEVDCAILEAVDNGELANETYLNFQKMERERTFFESNAAERKKKDKTFGKMVKNVKKQRKRDKY